MKSLAPFIAVVSCCGMATSQTNELQLSITPNGANLDFEWDTKVGMLYDLWSSSDLSSNSPSASIVEEGLTTSGIIARTSTPRPETTSMFYWVEEYTAPLVSVETVEVGNAGNANDSERAIGAVDYVYNIGKYEITNQQYITFMNAVDPLAENIFRLFNTGMTIDTINGGIVINLENFDGNKYSVKPGFENKPVSYVSFYSALRFCNWLHNGAQVGGDTENGAYSLEGGDAIPTNGESVLRNSDAKFTIPTTNEWYKAAYHQPSSDGGDVDDYWDYATGSNHEPIASPPPGLPTSANVAEALIQVTDVGSYTNSEGYYGTFDMTGNLEEWNENIAIVAGSLQFREKRGGTWITSIRSVSSSTKNTSSPSRANHLDSFRITSH